MDRPHWAWNPKIGQLVEHCADGGLLREAKKHNRYVSHKADAIEPRFELFLLDEGQQKVETKEETRKLRTVYPSSY
jgi:DNA-directed RNA polymerase II subunit RPB11